VESNTDLIITGAAEVVLTENIRRGLSIGQAKMVLAEKVDEPPLESGANVIVAIKVEGGVVEGMSEVVEDNATEAWEVDKAAKAIVTGNME
jgi:hypothetical protein